MLEQIIVNDSEHDRVKDDGEQSEHEVVWHTLPQLVDRKRILINRAVGDLCVTDEEVPTQSSQSSIGRLPSPSGNGYRSHPSRILPECR